MLFIVNAFLFAKEIRKKTLIEKLKNQYIMIKHFVLIVFIVSFKKKFHLIKFNYNAIQKS